MVYQWRVNTMQQQVCNAQHIGELFLLDAKHGLVILLAVFSSLYLLVQFTQPTCDESSCTTGKVCHFLANLRIYYLCHKLGQGSWCVELAGGTCRLHFFEDCLVYLTESMTFLIVTKVQTVNHIQHLAKLNAILHILVGIVKGCLYYRLADRCIRCYFYAFEFNKEGVIDKRKQFVACQGISASVVMRPVAPTAFFWNNGLVIIIVQLPIIFFLVIDLQKQHPCHLLYALRIAIDTSIIAHYIAYSFYEI